MRAGIVEGGHGRILFVAEFYSAHKLPPQGQGGGAVGQAAAGQGVSFPQGLRRRRTGQIDAYPGDERVLAFFQQNAADFTSMPIFHNNKIVGPLEPDRIPCRA